jgi:repressor LexA
MIGLTTKQREMLAFIERHLEANNGIAPTYDEMALGVGVASKSGVARLIDALEERGYIRRLRNRARALEVVPAEERKHPNVSLMAFHTDDLFRELERRGYRWPRVA